MSPVRTSALCLVLAACAPQWTAPVGEAPPPEGATLPVDFTEAAEDYAVPVEILIGLAQAQTRLQMIEGEEEFPGLPRSFGVMALRGENLQLAADLAGLDVEEVKSSRPANVLATASLLAFFAEEEGIDPSDLAAWGPVVARFSGIDDPEAAAGFVHNEVYKVLRRGLEMEGYSLPPMDVTADYPLPKGGLYRAATPGTIWTPSPNYNSRSGRSPEFVIIHTCEGAYSGCWSWLKNSASGVSAHYVVNDDGTEVRQLVDEANRAWHISANYDCDLNSRQECGLEGTSLNTLSIGIEHAGYGSQSSWDPGLIQRSADLTCGITDRNGIPRDSYHVIGHGQLQPWNRSDPGANWPWADYLNKIQVACGDTPGTTAPTPPPSGGGSGGAPSGSGPSGGGGIGTFVIDSNNNANLVADHFVEASGNWWGSANVSGYWNTGYYVGPTGSVSDPVSFWFHEEGEVCYTVEGWWTAGSDRPSSVAFIGWDEDDVEVGRATVSQKVNGSRWNVLGTWRFGAGWNRVLVSRWTTSGSYAIADAVRLTPATCP